MAVAARHDLPSVVYELEPGAASRSLPGGYRRRESEKTALHVVVRENLETLLEDARERSEGGYGYPGFVEKEFRRYLDCGLLAHGFSRLRCPTCGVERLVAFSCKGRVCPSCWARRTAETAADLVDRVLPVAPHRQWVLTFPWELRFLLAVEPEFLSEMLAVFLRTVFAWQRLQGRRLGLRGGETGSVTFTQRFGKLRSYCTSRTRIGSIFCRSAWFAPRPGSLAGLDTCRGRVVEVEPPDVPVVPVVLAAPV